MVGRKKIELPAITEEYLRIPDTKRTGKFVRSFHRWLRKNGITFAELKACHVVDYVRKPSRTKLSNIEQNNYRCVIRRYIDWLYQQGVISFSGQQIFDRTERLPEPAEAFLRSLEPTKRPGTCKGYRHSLRKFYQWLEEKDLDLESIDRKQIKHWLEYLHDSGQSAMTRTNIIVQVRIYLREMQEQGEFHEDADHLIRGRDFPKLPQYLPRPLPPEADRILCERLAESEDQSQQALLLMRSTGLRIGELRSLDCHCIRYDDEARAFLKVPIGKLHNERLVPLDERTLELVKCLQKKGRQDRTWLLETVTGRKTTSEPYARVLKAACADLDIQDSVTTHRLRHTYATTLMNAGMSLMGIMKLLGHRDYRMTLRYTAIADETVGREYFEALAQIERLYDWKQPRIDPSDPRAPALMLDDVIHWLRARQSGNQRRDKTADNLIRRLEHAKKEIGAMRCLKA